MATTTTTATPTAKREEKRYTNKRLSGTERHTAQNECIFIYYIDAAGYRYRHGLHTPNEME